MFKRNIRRKLRLLKINLTPLEISINNKRYIRVVRIANEGFNVKAYKTEGVYFHVGDFINVQVRNSDDFILKIDEGNVIETDHRHVLMEGCHCFFYKFDFTQTEGNGNLSFRLNHKINIGYFPIDEWVWVSNVKHNMQTYVHEITRKTPHPTSGILYEFYKRPGKNTDWVKMSLNLAKKRTDMHLEDNLPIREEISEFYLLSEQLEKLLIPSKKQLFLASIKNMFN